VWAICDVAVKPLRFRRDLDFGDSWFNVQRLAAGWSMRCLWGATEVHCWSSICLIRGSSPARPQPPPYASGHRPAQPGLVRLIASKEPDQGVVPFFPIYSGLAINTAFYASFWWLLFLAPGTLRRHLRRRRAQCLRCGYDLRGTRSNACPECGAARALQVL
jgi:hypothetical protein